MKLRTLFTSLLLLMAVSISASISSGYYRLKSYNSKYLTENTSSHTLVCSELASTTNYSQVWELTIVNETFVRIKNVLTDRYIYGNGGQFTTSESFVNFSVNDEGDGVYSFYLGYNDFGLHCDNSNNVVSWTTSEAKSKWTIETVSIDETALATQKTAMSEASTSDLLKVFTTTACTELKSGYSASDLTALPATTQTLATKIQNNSWTTYDGWNKTEKTFRIADYKAYSSHTRWTDILGLGWSFGCLTNPTGISVSAGDYIQVYVGEIPSGQAVQLVVAGDYQSSGTTYNLKQGMNVLLMASTGNCFVNYEVDNTTDGKAPYTSLSNYADVTVHIEGGTVNGYFDLTKGDADFDWSAMQFYLLKGSCVELKTNNLLFHMQTNLVKAACPEKIVELLGEWDKILNMEYSLMGLEEFNGYWNNMLSVTDMSGQDYMHASTYGTYYDVNTLSSIMSYDEMFAGGALWGPAHENGHIFQKYINMIGQTEVSNNLFSNVAIFNNGHLTSRASNSSLTFQNMANNVFWNDRGIWERTHLYFQLYQFFHILGKKADFYPELFKAFRNDPMEHTGGIFISATDDYLKFYKKCCEVSGYDLTEFFQAYGFFVIPELTSYTLDNITKDAYQVGDYGTYYLTVTQDEIDAVKAEVAAMNLPKANIIFIEDRITAPDATYEGATAGEKKAAFDNNEFPIGQAGETGQYTTFGETCSAYKYNVKGNDVMMEGTGAVGFKVYDSAGNLRGLYNTYNFTLPDGIGTGYSIKAAAGNGTDATATFDASVGTIKSDVTDNLGNATDVVTIGTQITSESGIISGKAYVLKTGANAYVTDATTYYYVPNSANLATKASTYIFISNGDGTWKIKNYFTGKYWGVPVYNTALAPAEKAAAGAWSLNFSGGIAYPTAPDADNTARGIDRSSEKVWSYSTGTNNNHKVYIYETDLASIASDEFTDKDINVSSEAAATLQTNQWYVMFDRGANHGYLYENGENKLYNTATIPSGSASDNAKYLVRIVGCDNEYYLQTGLGNFFGKIQQSTAVPTTATATEQITIKKISDTDGHFYLMSADGIVLDANALTNGDATVVGWGSTVPTATGGNNDWAFYPVELVESQELIANVYTINNTNSNRGALTYEPSKSTTYVWSSGKSGATAFDASNPNHQWVIVPTDKADEYYLYNVGADKFAIPSGIAQGSNYSWVFSDNAVAVVFEDQNDGTKKIKMASTPVSGTNAAYMAVSNSYTGPIINYNDVGGNFTITKVGNVTAKTQAEAAVARLVKSQTALTSYPQTSGWYAIQIKSKTGSASYSGRYLQLSSTLYNGLYPMTFTGGVDIQPAITDPTFLTYINCTSWDNNTWQLPDGRYLVSNSSSKFPTPSTTAGNVICGYENGNYFKSNNNYYADPYNSNANYFIGETSYMRTAYTVYPVNLEDAGITAWHIFCDGAPETAQITCTRNDVVGLTSVYKNGYIFLPTGTTPIGSDFALDGATDASVDATAKTVTLSYNPDLAIVEGGITVEQGWQTAARGEEVMLLRVNANPFRDATGVSMSVSLKDGSEANISRLILYEASTNSPEILSAGNDGAPTKTQVTTANVSSSSVSLSIGNLSAGTHYYWLGATVTSDATLGAVVDAAVTGITYTCNDKETNLDLTAIGDPSDRGAMVFNTHSYPFLPRENGSRVYRIPAMIVADDGSIVVACDKRYNSHTDIGAGHVIDIVIRRSTDGGKTWSDPLTIAKGLGTADDAKCGYGDPSLVKGKDGKLYCLFVAGNLGYFYGQKRIAMSTSTDNGVTWSSNTTTPPIDLLESGRLQNYNTVGEAGYGLYDYFVTSGRGLYIPEDDILMYLIPGQTMTSATEHTGNSQDYIFYSTDGGEKWYFSEDIMFQGGDEAKIIRMNDGSLLGTIRQAYNRGFNTATYTKNNDGTLSFTMGTQYNNSQLSAGGSANNQDILYYQRETVAGKKDVIIHSMTTGQHANFKLYYSTDQGQNWTEFMTVQTKGTRYVTMDKSGTDENPGSLYLFFEDQSLNSAGGYTDYNHYPLNFVEITREQLLQYIPDLDKSVYEKDVKIVSGTSGEETYGTWANNKTTWTSKDASGIVGMTLTKDGGTFNKFSSWNSHYNLAYMPATANAMSTLTLTAPDGYVIKSYSLLAAKAYSAAHTFTLSLADGTNVQPAFASTESGYTNVNLDNIYAKSTTIGVTTTDGSKYIALADFTVTLTPQYPLSLNKVGDASYATLYLPFDVTMPEGTVPYAVEVKGNYAVLHEIVGGLPAGTPAVVVNGGGAKTVQLRVASALEAYSDANALVGTYTDMTLDLAADNGKYSLGRQRDENNDYVIGFYKFNNVGNTSITLKANRAYLQTSAQAPSEFGVKGFRLLWNNANAITATDADNAPTSTEIYDLSGRRVSKPTRGIYIVGGRKVLVR